MKTLIEYIRQHGILIGILALALGIRLIYLYQAHDTPLFEVLLIDSHYYDQTGLEVAAGAWSKNRVFFMNPFYTYFLGIVYSIFGHSWIIPCIIQSFTGTASCALIYSMGTQLFNRNIGLLAASMAAIYGVFIFYDGALLTSNPILFFNIASLWSLIKWQENKKSVWLIFAGLCLGFSATARGLILLFMVVLPVWFYMLTPSIRNSLITWAWVLLGIGLVLVPIGMRNKLVGGNFAITPSGSGQAFYSGNNPKATGIFFVPDFLTSSEPQFEFADYLEEAKRRSGKDLSNRDASWFWIGEGMRFILGQPKAYIRIQLKKVYLFWNRTEVPNNLSYYFAHDFVPILHILILGWGIVAPLGLSGLFFAHKQPEHWLLYIYLTSYFLACFIFFVTAEYRYPVVPVLMIGAAWLLHHSYKYWKNKEKRKIIAPIIFALLLALPINYQNDFAKKLTTKRIDYFNFATLYSRQGNLKQAEKMYRKSLSIDPNFTTAHRALVELYQKQGRVDEMLKANRQIQLKEQGLSSEIDPLQQALEAFTQKRYKSALAHFKTVVQRQPRPEHYNNIGLCHYRLRQFSEAETAYKQAIKQQPNYTKAYYNLAVVYLQTNRQTLAESVLMKTLELDPQYFKAYFKLGELYSQTQRPNEAIKAWTVIRQAFPQDTKIVAKIDSVKNTLNSDPNDTLSVPAP